MKKILAVIIACSSLATGAFADCCGGKASAPSVKIGGKFEFGGAGRMQDSLKDEQKKMSKNIDNAAFYSSAVLTADVSAESEDLGLKYGASLGFAPLHSKAKPNPSYLYLESLIGKFELGAGKTVMTQMSITGWDTSCGIGDSWSIYYKGDPDDRGVSYMEDFCNFLDFSHRKKGSVDFSRKISYFTPKIYGFQAGVSYIPDASNSGSDPLSTGHDTYRNPGIEDVYNQIKADPTLASDEKRLDKIKDKDWNKINVTHGVSAAVKYEYDIAEEVKVAVSLTGEYAKANNSQKTPDPLPAEQKKADLLNWIIGGKVSYNNIDLAGSYRNAGKSFTSEWQDGKEEDARQSYGYDVGVKYKFGNAAASLNYFHSNAKKSELNTVSIGADYTLAPGLTPYVQAVKFGGVGKYKDLSDASIKDDKKAAGYLFIIGTRLKF
jgi:predicted porin